MDQFESDAREFYEAMGRAVSQWATIENALYSIFERGLCLRDSREAAAAFYSQINFRAKLDMTTAVMEVYLSADMQAKWKSLHRRLKKKSKLRAAVAHNIFMFQAAGKPGTVLQLVPMLKPNSDDPRRLPAFVSGKDDIDLKRLKQITNEFVVMTHDLKVFLAAMPTRQPQVSP